ncbi:SDR family oxidoreductase [Phaeovulum sp. W22_SRMD_FR3]|uniref:SDR family oxidoreductase n=1 Tax=Phaeovulum sp. W22_SRMD_FR3 TaxID=3240274 RepID=UPI003F95F463
MTRDTRTGPLTGAVLITGGAKRLGRAMALHLAGRGYDLALHYDSSAEAAEATAAEARDRGVRVVTLQADLLDEAATAGLVPRAVAALGPLGLLINNASIFEEDSLQTATRTSWDRHFGSNLRAPFVLTQAFAAQAPGMDQTGTEPRAQALVVNMVDQRVRRLTPKFMTYTLAKAALWTLTQTAAQELAPAVRVNAIGPGPTLQGARQTPEDFAAQRAATVLHRGADPVDICAALDYLIAAPAVTGQLICVDGGQHLAWQTADSTLQE